MEREEEVTNEPDGFNCTGTPKNWDYLIGGTRDHLEAVLLFARLLKNRQHKSKGHLFHKN
uniref:Uncharacterized protein n=1 Tax=Megaselia scalaris TaxID=36166 RepID=T1H037_MEGSC